MSNPIETAAPSFGAGAAAPLSMPGSDVGEKVRAVADQVSEATQRLHDIEKLIGGQPSADRATIFGGYIGVFIVAFVVTLLMTPIMRRLAIANGIIDHPNEARKMHKLPIAYLGGVAVYLGVMAGIVFSFLAPSFGLIEFHATKHMVQGAVPHPQHVPMSILAGLTIIVIIGLLDDVINVTPMQKIGGMLIAAAFLAMEDVGVKVAQQVLTGVGSKIMPNSLALPEQWVWVLGQNLQIDVIYWTGTAVIAIFVLGACNAINLIDGLDGLCSGVSAIAGACLTVMALTLAANDNGPLDGARIVLCLALVGGCLGFLPHNFNPASIFLGDAGSLMLGYLIIVIVLTLGDTGQTNLVLCGLVIFAVPMIDTSLAIVRRKLAGQSISSADDNHLHHILKRMLGVRGAVMVLYAMGAAFGLLGIALQMSKSRVVYAIVLVAVSFIGVIALKSARRKQIEDDAAKKLASGASPASTESAPPGLPLPAQADVGATTARS